LVGMGVLPLNFTDGQSAASLGLDGNEVFDIEGLVDGAPEVTVNAKKPDGDVVSFKARVRIDTPKEWLYYKHGGVLNYVLRELAA
ncbi:MAG: hypothetical protein VX836_08035, partial [Pseudomonadota bacterium]|nr:hypothetical protein [Pseudomonadota bacterium]